MLDDDTYLAADNSHNLVVLRKVTDAGSDEERGRLQVRALPLLHHGQCPSSCDPQAVPVLAGRGAGQQGLQAFTHSRLPLCCVVPLPACALCTCCAQLVGEYHLGEFINRIRPGSLVLRLPDSELAQVRGDAPHGNPRVEG